MKFSILSSIYYKENSKNFHDCMVSLWENQNLKPEEMILVEDGELTPELYSIISKWKYKLGNLLKIIKLAQNVGLGNALNEGLKYCSNEWVFRMDTDDICKPDRFEKQIKYIVDNPDIVLLGGQIEEFDEKMETSLGLRKVPCTHQEIIKLADIRSPFNHMTVCYKKSFIEKIGGYQHHLYMEDYNLWLRVLKKTLHVANLPDVLVDVRSGEAMYKRRKGLEYVKSEWKLAHLKYQIGLQNRFISYFYFSIRTLPRFLSGNLLGKLYKKLRN